MSKHASKRRFLIVGEGRETEYNYFVGFRNAFGKELEATATSVRVARGKGGDARSIVENAIKAAKKFQPNRKRGDRVFLVMDTEGSGREPKLPKAEQLAKNEGVEIVYSCPAIEYWLLCHFENISRRHFPDCNAVIVDLDKKWSNVCKISYDKADLDVFDRLKNRLDSARAQALTIDLHHCTTAGTALKTNPSTQVYELIALLIGVQTGGMCPVAGTWKLVGDASVTVRLNKGDNVPFHKGNTAHWQL